MIFFTTLVDILKVDTILFERHYDFMVGLMMKRMIIDYDATIQNWDGLARRKYSINSSPLHEYL